MNSKTPDFIGDFLTYNVENEASKLYLTWCAVSAIASAAQRKISLWWGQDVYYPNFYILLVGPPGAGRKGTAINPAQRLLNEVGVNLAPDSVTREQLIRRLEASIATYEDPQTNEIIQHCSLTVVSPEFAVFVGNGAKNVTLLSDLTDWFDCRSKWEYETKQCGINCVYGVYVNMLAATTPQQIHTTLPLEYVGTGLTSRIIFVYSGRKRKTVVLDTFSASAKGKALWVKLREQLTKIFALSGNFKISKSYLTLYSEWYDTMPEDPPFDPTRFSPYWSRRPTHFRKLSMIMALSRGAGVTSPLVLEEIDFNRAQQLLVKTEESMSYAFSFSGKSVTSDMLAHVLEFLKKRGSCYANEILRVFYRDLDSATLETIIKTFTTIGAAEVVIKPLGQYITYVPEGLAIKATPINQRQRKLKEGVR